MKKNDFIKKVIELQKQGIPKGIYSICTANEFVIEAALEKALRDNSFILIESTCNQVNQYGGYTGMNPGDFKKFIHGIAQRTGFPLERLILGGDHLGPNPWKNEDAETAMKKAGKMIEDYVLAGYTKIHIDTSMYLADDPGDRTKALDSSIIAERGAELALRAEKAYQKLRKKTPEAEPPVYVIGTEVPVPGGTEKGENEIEVTSPSDLAETVRMFKEYFLNSNLQNAWERVVAVVVQPGVEFGADYIVDYNREKARDLSKSLNNNSGLVFEAHSTDYQKPLLLKQMVEDGFSILKVGPVLTFALREALFILEYIERELLIDKEIELSNLQEILDAVMIENPANWQNYYQGSEKEIKLARKYSLSDRARYYWAMSAVKRAVSRLINNLRSTEVPLTIISQFMPEQYKKIRNGLLENEPVSLIKDRIINVINDYVEATNPEEG